MSLIPLPPLYSYLPQKKIHHILHDNRTGLTTRRIIEESRECLDVMRLIAAMKRSSFPGCRGMPRGPRHLFLRIFFDVAATPDFDELSRVVSPLSEQFQNLFVIVRRARNRVAAFFAAGVFYR
jgi:hypothetical protein